MEDLLLNPAVQAGVAPFLAALVASAALRRARLLGLAVVAAFVVVVGLAVGFSFEPLTATRKLVLVGLAMVPLILGVELADLRPTPMARATIAAASGAAAVWMLWRILQQQEAAKAALYGVAAAVYLAALVESCARCGTDGTRAASASLMLGLCAGALALLGASAQLAQIGIAVGAGGGAVLLAHMIGLQRGSPGWTPVLPAAFIAGLVGLSAVFTGALPWFCLLPPLAIPWATRLVRQERHRPWLAAVLTSLAAVIPLILAVGLAWLTAGIPQ